MVDKKQEEELWIPEGYEHDEKGKMVLKYGWMEDPETGLSKKDPSKWMIHGKVPINWKPIKVITDEDPFKIYKTAKRLGRRALLEINDVTHYANRQERILISLLKARVKDDSIDKFRNNAEI